MIVSDDASGREALAQIDLAIAARPRRDGTALSAATSKLAAYRDLLIVAHRENGGAASRVALDHVNAVLSIVLAAEFPLGEIPWDEMVLARQWLADVLHGNTQPNHRHRRRSSRPT